MIWPISASSGGSSRNRASPADSEASAGTVSSRSKKSLRIVATTHTRSDRASASSAATNASRAVWPKPSIVKISSSWSRTIARRASATSVSPAAVPAAARPCRIGKAAWPGASRNKLPNRSAVYCKPASSGSAVGARIAAARPSNGSPPVSDGRSAPQRTSPTRPIMPGSIRSGSSPALTSEDLPEPLAPSTRTKAQLAASRRASNSRSSLRARVRPKNTGACS